MYYFSTFFPLFLLCQFRLPVCLVLADTKSNPANPRVYIYRYYNIDLKAEIVETTLVVSGFCFLRVGSHIIVDLIFYAPPLLQISDFGG